MSKFFYDSDHVRYELCATREGQGFNWLFFPGGPGADSSYFHSLIQDVTLPGNVWLIDMPGNGSNTLKEQYNFDKWIDIFPKIIRRFENPVLVGHSFGGMFPLLFPELEQYLKGYIILNAAPTLWLEEAAAYAAQFDVPDLSKEVHDFTCNPNPETFQTCLNACMPYYFPKHTLEKGRQLLSQVAFEHSLAVWWMRKAVELNFSAQWIPQSVPTLIINAKYDCIVPYTLFQNDTRFRRPNIERLVIEDAGHFIWVENPAAAKQAFQKMCAWVQK